MTNETWAHQQHCHSQLKKATMPCSQQQQKPYKELMKTSKLTCPVQEMYFQNLKYIQKQKTKNNNNKKKNHCSS